MEKNRFSCGYDHLLTSSSYSSSCPSQALWTELGEIYIRQLYWWVPVPFQTIAYSDFLGGTPASFRSLIDLRFTVVKDDPTAVGSKIIVDAACELLSLENWASCICEVVEVSTETSSSGVRGGIDAHFDAIDEMEERFEKGSVQILTPDFFAHHNYYYKHQYSKDHHLFFFFPFFEAASFSILIISFWRLIWSDAKNSFHSSSSCAFLVFMLS